MLILVTQSGNLKARSWILPISCLLLSLAPRLTCQFTLDDWQFLGGPPQDGGKEVGARVLGGCRELVLSRTVAGGKSMGRRILRLGGNYRKSGIGRLSRKVVGMKAGSASWNGRPSEEVNK